MLLTSFSEIDGQAVRQGPKKLVVLAPEDEEFLLAVKDSTSRGYVEPILIGSEDRIKRLADRIAFDISEIEKIYEDDRQVIADQGIRMLFDGTVDIASKGQIPTAYIYRAIIREESGIRRKTVSVVTLLEIQGLGRLTSFTDTGVSIHPDFQTKLDIIANAVFVFHLLGYRKPRVAVLSGQREIGGSLTSAEHAAAIRKAYEAGEPGECEVMSATCLTDILFPPGKPFSSYDDINLAGSSFPEIMVVPELTTGNILAKLDFAFPHVRRRSLVMSSRGPVIIPSRSDFHDAVTGEIATGVVVAARIKEGTA